MSDRGEWLRDAVGARQMASLYADDRAVQTVLNGLAAALDDAAAAVAVERDRADRYEAREQGWKELVRHMLSDNWSGAPDWQASGLWADLFDEVVPS